MFRYTKRNSPCIDKRFDRYRFKRGISWILQIGVGVNKSHSNSVIEGVGVVDFDITGIAMERQTSRLCGSSRPENRP